MSYEIVKSIGIQDNKVYFTSVSNNVYPKEFERYEVKSLSEIYGKGGLEALLPVIAANVWNGNIKLYKSSKLCKLLSEGYENISQSVMLRNFLDTKRASNYIASWVLYRMEKGPEPDLNKLHALRLDKEAVLDICSKNPMAFNFAGDSVCKDRETAKAHIIANGHMLMFNMPLHFRKDKELAKLAIERKGTLFRQLDPSIMGDKELISLAFDSTLNRPTYETSPQFIPPEVRKDTAFMVQLILKCPRMKLFETPDLAENKDLVKALFNTRNWDPYILRNIPNRILKSPEILDLIQTSLQEKPVHQKLAQQILFSEKGVLLKKPSLQNQVERAENKNAAKKNLDPGKAPEQGLESR